MAPIVIKDGKAVHRSQVQPPPASGGLGGLGKAAFVLAAVLVGPSLLQQLYVKLTAEKVDLSDFNIVTSYDTPAIEMRDDVVRIQFCASWQVNGQFRRAALELQDRFPGLKVEGGPYTPPAAVQYGIRAVRVGQAGVGVFFFFGEQILARLGRPPFEFMAEMPTRIMYHIGALYGFNVIADCLKSINAFEIVYNGRVLHSKLKSGGFPQPGELSRALESALAAEGKQAK